MIFIIILFLLGLFSIYFLSDAKRRHTLFGTILKESLIGSGIWIVVGSWLLSVSHGNSFFVLIWTTAIPNGYFLFMANLYWLLPKTERKNNRKIIFYLARLIPLIILLSPFLLMFFNLGSRKGMSTQTCLSILFATMVIPIALAWFVYRQNKEKISQLSSLKKALGKSTADFQFLRSQINPHFLFNVLNTLYGMAIRENALKTGVGIQKLGDMMRFMLQDNQKDMILLASEINYLRDYIYLQQLRLVESENMKMKVDISEPSPECLIAPMLLIPFVENAFKHGVRLQEVSWITIELNYKNKCLEYEVRNSLHHKVIHDDEKELAGIGLENVKERLKLLYPGKHYLMISKDEKEFVVHLTLDL